MICVKEDTAIGESDLPLLLFTLFFDTHFFDTHFFDIREIEKRILHTLYPLKSKKDGTLSSESVP